MTLIKTKLEKKNIYIIEINNPKKIKALEDMGIKVNQRIPIFSDTNKYNEKYISTKKSKLGHLI